MGKKNRKARRRERGEAARVPTFECRCPIHSGKPIARREYENSLHAPGCTCETWFSWYWYGGGREEPKERRMYALWLRWQKYTQAEIARLVGISVRTVQRWLKEAVKKSANPMS